MCQTVLGQGHKAHSFIEAGLRLGHFCAWSDVFCPLINYALCLVTSLNSPNLPLAPPSVKMGTKPTSSLFSPRSSFSHALLSFCPCAVHARNHYVVSHSKSGTVKREFRNSYSPRMALGDKLGELVTGEVAYSDTGYSDTV